ncbi:MAG: 3-dehydroquinate synthase [Rickettsiales bacterium]|nr:3-dehydroquinate synthase [Rickettsiales bacterium]
MKVEKINVDLKERSYPIIISNELENLNITKILKNLNPSKIIVVTDKTVDNFYAEYLRKVFIIVANKFHKIVLPPGEKIKSYSYLEFLLEKILKFKIDRNSLIISFGGGVIGDLTGLAANLLMRGLPIIQIPTSLLAQVDSSVGGKTGINSKFGKNLIGTFSQPNSVLISTGILKTLDKREVFAGYAEILKYSLIHDKKFFNWLLNNGEKIISLESKNCIYAIKKSCQIKANIVSLDEKELGIREILNFGHTFAHAIETYTGFKKIIHGEAVFIGMILAIKLSVFLGLCDKKILDNVISHLRVLKIPYQLSDYDVKIPVFDFMKLLKFDKKTKRNNIKFILIEDIGKPVSYIVKNEIKIRNFLKKELF